ncbi:UNVERIFIED_ORG: hypothetical protein ABID33_002301 [Xanthobacter viscosus]|uniref:hypothetical protein n=1 Tax=Xanthobacter autotrophicus TaxID=280 RepID=UPI001476FEF7|nr:hypothetical protein [Xanthobacter autotrophicus]
MLIGFLQRLLLAWIRECPAHRPLGCLETTGAAALASELDKNGRKVPQLVNFQARCEQN